MLSTRLALLDLVARHGLDADTSDKLFRLAGLDRPPGHLLRWVRRGLALLAAVLGGLGIIFWVAANWEDLGRAGQFVLLQGTILIFCVGAALRPAARTPLGMLALLAIGALFAAFGQAYQTGADPWQLFALWALLGLPLALGARSDAIWTFWIVIAMAAVGLWGRAHWGFSWNLGSGSSAAQMATSGVALALVLLLDRRLWRFSGAGPWSLGAAVTLACSQATVAGCAGLFGHGGGLPYALALMLCSLLAANLASRRVFDVYGLSIALLAINFLVVAGMARRLMSADTLFGSLLLIGGLAAGLLTLSVRLVLRLSRQYQAEGVRA